MTTLGMKENFIIHNRRREFKCLSWSNFSLLLITSNSATGESPCVVINLHPQIIELVEGNTLPSTFLIKVSGATESLSNRKLLPSKYLAVTFTTLIPPP